VHRSFDLFIVNEISIDSGCIIDVEACLPSSERIFIFSVYIPAASLPIQQFKEHVDTLHELYSVYSEVEIVILMGDFNAKIEGSRYQFKPNDRSIYLLTMLNELNAFSVSSENMCVGPLYTFQGYENGPVSMIDHIVISKELTSNVCSALVLTEGGMKVSDHHPVLCKVSLNTVMSRRVIYPDLTKRIAWDKARQNGCIDDYTFSVSESVWTWKMDYDNVEQYYNDIINALKKAATETLPTVSFKKTFKALLEF
jgi:hypothetical protein